MPSLSPLLPYTTLFRSRVRRLVVELPGQHAHEPAAGGALLPLGPMEAIAHGDQRGAATHTAARATVTVTGVLALSSPSIDTLDRKSTRLNSSHLVISYAVPLPPPSLHDALPISGPTPCGGASRPARSRTCCWRCSTSARADGSNRAWRSARGRNPYRSPRNRDGDGRSGAQLPVDRHLRSEEHTSELQSPCNLVCRPSPPSFPTRRSSDLGSDALWWSFPASTLTNLLLAVLYFRSGRWKQSRMAISAGPQPIPQPAQP